MEKCKFGKFEVVLTSTVAAQKRFVESGQIFQITTNLLHLSCLGRDA